MTVEHRIIADPNIHEPKNIASAASNTAYIANGTGSGTWTDVSQLLAVHDYLYIGTGSPETVVTADVGSLFIRTDGGTSTSFYVKESGTGNTGWVAK